MTALDTRARGLTIAAPRGYAKTITWQFYDDAEMLTASNLSTWSAWELLIFRPLQPVQTIAGVATGAAGGAILTTLPSSLLVPPRTRWLLRATTPTPSSTPTPILGGPLAVDDGTADAAGPGLNPIVNLLAGATVKVLNFGAAAISGGGGAVDSVNGDTGVVVLTATDVGADPAGTAAGLIATEATARGAADTAEALARTTADNLLIPLTQKAAASGVATLDGTGKIPQAQLPAVAIVNYLGPAANQAAMLALVGQEGDWTIRSDRGSVFIVTAQPSSSIGNWQELGYPAAPVTSVAGRTGTIVLTSADLTDFTEAVQDVVGALIAAGTGITATYNDAGGIETLAVDATVIATRAYVDTQAALALAKAQNLADVASAPTSRYNLHDQVLAACKAAATANVASKSGTTTIDGVALADGDLVLLTAQTAPAENGPWFVHAGAWTRPLDYPAAGTAISRVVAVQQGTSYAGTLWESYGASTTATIDTTATTWAITNRAYFDGRYGPISQIGTLAARPAANAVLTGTEYASNDTFELFRSNGTTWDKIADIANLPRYGRASSAGHSYSQTSGTKGALTTGIATFDNFTHRVAAFLNVSAEETFLLGRSGGQAGLANVGDTDQQGTGLVYRFVQPGHRLEPWTAAGIYPTSKSWPGLFLLMFGVNDAGRAGVVSTSPVNQPLVAYTNGMRAMVSRIMAAQLYSTLSTAVFTTITGFGTTVTDPAWTDGQYRKSQTNTDAFTITVPVEFKGGTLAVSLVGGTGITVNVSAMTNVATAVTLTDPFSNGQHTLLQNGDVLRVESEDMTIVSGGGTLSLTVTRGVNGTAAVAHGAVTGYLTAATARVNWSGTATGATGSTFTGGQGCVAQAGAIRTLVPVVKRFALTAADAGKTIIGTVAGLVGSNEFVGVDACWIEDTDPNTVLLVNQPNYNYGVAPASFFIRVTAALFNGALATIAGEFTAGNVAVVDIATLFDQLFYGTLQTAISTTPSAGTVTTGIKYTPSTAAQNLLAPGAVIRADAEQMLVTAVDKTNGGANNGIWDVSAQRGYNSSTVATHAISSNVYDQRWLSVDLIHPSDEGHVRIAAQIIATLLLQSQTSRQKANAGGLVLRRRPRIADGAYLPGIPSSKSTAAGPAIGDAHAYPIEVPELVVGLSINAEVTTLAATGSSRVTLFTDGGGFPGQKIAEATFATTSTGEKVGTFPIPVLLMPGFYWLVYQTEGSGAVPTMRANNGAPFTPQYPWQFMAAGAQSSPLNATTAAPVAYTWSPGAGTLPAQYSAPPTGFALRTSNHTLIELVVSVPRRDT